VRKIEETVKLDGRMTVNLIYKIITETLEFRKLALMSPRNLWFHSIRNY